MFLQYNKKLFLVYVGISQQIIVYRLFRRTFVRRCAIWYHLYNFKNVTPMEERYF